ncbi:hypothetical protein [Clostridium sp.]
MSKVETSRIIQKTEISGNNQALSIKGNGYEFEPIIVDAANNVNTFLILDLNEFDNPTGTFEIAISDIGNIVGDFKNANLEKIREEYISS